MTGVPAVNLPSRRTAVLSHPRAGGLAPPLLYFLDMDPRARLTMLAVGVVLEGVALAQGFPPLGSAHPGFDRAAVGRDVYREAVYLRSRQQLAEDYDVDLAPVLDNVLAYVHAIGIPLRPDPELAGEEGIAFSASWRVGRDMPAVNFHVGDSGPLDAFYANEGGFRWALAWPLHRFKHVALHVEGGEDSEFGNWAIVGMQWRHPKRPWAVGLGMPVSMAEADGPVGVVCQVRILLE